jgi:hypothetical protein
LFGARPANINPAYGVSNVNANANAVNANAVNSQPIMANSPFSCLPLNAQQVIDGIHNLMHQHNSTMASVSTMTPSLLGNVDGHGDGNTSIEDPYNNNNNMTSSSSSSSLATRMQQTHTKLNALKELTAEEHERIQQVQQEAETLYAIAHQCGIYPVQNIARRKHIDIGLGLGLGVGGHDQTNSNANATDAAGNTIGNNPTTNHANTNINANTPTPTQQPQPSENMQRLNAMLQENASHVDRREGMPSLYLWRTMEDLRHRIQGLYHKIHILKQGFQSHPGKGVGNITGVGGITSTGTGVGGAQGVSLAYEKQVETLVRVADLVQAMDQRMDALRAAYKKQLAKEHFQRTGAGAGMGMGVGMGMGMGMSGGMGMGVTHGMGGGVSSQMQSGTCFDPFRNADQKEIDQENRLDMEARKRIIQASVNIPSMNVNANANANPAVSVPVGAGVAGGGLFGAPSPSAAPSAFGGFGSPAPAAPGGGGLFGAAAATPLAAPAAGGFSFGGTPAAAPAAASGGFGFGGGTPAAAAAPAAGGLFGSTAAPAPAAGGFGFGGTPAAAAAPAPAAGGGLFGTTAPAAAPAVGGFGAAAAPAAGGFSFGGTPGAAAAAVPAAGGLFGAAPAAAAAPTTAKMSRRRSGRRR